MPAKWTSNWTGIRAFYAISIVSLVLTLAAVILVDTFPLSGLAHIDYLSIFYVAGTMVRTGLGPELYLPLGSCDFVNAPFSKFAHHMLPGLRTGWNWMFLYPPPVACFFVPLSLLPARSSMIVWQVVTIMALYLSSRIFSRSSQSGWITILSSFTLLAVFHILILGQSTIVFVLLPLVSGYVLWKANKGFLTGLVWSILWLKAQVLLPLLVLIAAWCAAKATSKVSSSKQDSTAVIIAICAGLAAGGAALLLISYFAVGPQSISNWLNCVHEFGRQFILSGNYSHYVFAGSLPVVLNILGPNQHSELYSQAVQVFIVLMFSVLFFFLYRLMRYPGPWSFKQDLAIVLSIGALPIVSPYLSIYDLVVFILILWIYGHDFPAGELKKRLQHFLIISWLGLDFYICTCTWLSGSRYTLLFIMTMMTIAYFRFGLAVLRLCDSGGNIAPSVES